MKLIMHIMILLILATLFVGCAGPKVDINRGYETLINQKRTYTAFEVIIDEGGSITGPVHIIAEGQLEPIKALPQTPGTAEKAIDGLVSVTRTGIAVWGTVEGINSLSKRPQVIEATIVRPEIVKVPVLP